ncbi:MAG: GNAT family N-acetyltransferase [Ktedonobacterales bacterium]
MSADSERYLLQRDAYPVLADALGEHVETVISVHQLRRGLCHAYIIGRPHHFDAVILQSSGSTELRGFGHDASALYELLRVIPHWSCVDVAPESAHALGQLIEQQLGITVRYYADLHHALKRPVVPCHSAAVRQLAPSDISLLETAPEEVRPAGFETMHALLTEGIVAAALIEGRFVACAYTSARSRDYADLAVATLEPWRNRGFARSAAALVAQKVQEAGQIPVWSTGEDNAASLRVAETLGFTKATALTYVILQGNKAWIPIPFTRP